MAEVTSSTDALNAATPTNGTGQAFNPKSVLDKDAFLRLFLAELQNQDPTDPMDTEKIITQTADLTTVESMENVTKSISSLVTAYQSTSGMNTISAVGKMADTGLDSFNMGEGGMPVDFDMYFETAYTQGEVFVFDTTGNLVKKIQVEDGDKGLISVHWDGTDESGNKVDPGLYKVEAAYKDSINGQQLYTKLGMYPIDSVLINGEEAQARLGNEYFKFSQIREISEPYTPVYQAQSY